MRWLKKYTAYISVGIILLGVLYTIYWLNIHQANQITYPVKRTIRYSFTVQNPTNRLIEQAEFWTFSPISQTSLQKLSKISSTEPHRMASDLYGNQRMIFTIKNLPPYGNKVVSISAELDLADSPNKFDEPQLAPYLMSEQNVQIADTEIKSLAKNLQGKDEEQTVKNIYQWIVNNIDDAGFVKEDHGATYALQHKKGDCTEYMYLFTALSRANNIPSRGMAGYVYGENAILKPHDYHNWSEVYIDGRWRVVDPQKKQLMVNESDYIAMRTVAPTESVENNLGTQEFFHSAENLNVSMN